MEIDNILYEKIANSWNIILDFLDINSIFQIEISSKFFRNRLLSYYESKENLIKNTSEDNNKSLNEGEKKESIINFKKTFLSNYYNLLINIDISNAEFNNEENKNSFDIIKKPYMKSESMLYKKNKIMIRLIFIERNYICLLYEDNTFYILQFDLKDNSKKFHEIYSHDFLKDIIINFKYYENQDEKIIFFVKKNSDEFFFLNLNEEEKNMKKIELKKEYEIFKEENISLKEIFILNEFILFFTDKDEFILIPNDLLKIFKQKKLDKKINDNSESNSEKSEKNSENNNEKNDSISVPQNKILIENSSIPYPQKLENNYGKI